MPGTSGSTEYLTYGEIGDEKGGLVVDSSRHEVCHLALPCTLMVDLGSIPCEGVHPKDITGEIVARITRMQVPAQSMVQVTLDGMSREHGKGIDMKDLSCVREQLLDLKIRVKGKDEESPVPLQQDIRTVDYLQEFTSFIGKQQLSARRRRLSRSTGLMSCGRSWNSTGRAGNDP